MTQTEILSFVVQTLYWFFLYGCICWGVEVVYAAIKERRLVNRGFLCGPICPIYGCGMVVLNWTVAALAPSGEGKSVSTVAVFFVGMVLTTAIELVGGWTLFKIYHIRWWDYSNMKFNIGGYICPQFSLLWGLGSVIMVKVVHPALAKASSPLPMKVLVPAEAAVLALFVVDLIVSAAAATGLNKKLKEIDEVRARLRVTSDKLTTVLGEQKLQLALAKLEGRENAAELKLEMLLRANEMRAKLRDISVDKIGTRRLLRAFPDMKSLTYAETLASTRAGVRRLPKRWPRPLRRPRRPPWVQLPPPPRRQKKRLPMPRSLRPRPPKRLPPRRSKRPGRPASARPKAPSPPKTNRANKANSQ